MIMELIANPLEVIPRRASWRTYDGEPLADEPAQRLSALLADPPEPPFGSRVRLHLLADFDAEARGVSKLGTYGVIKGARSYLVGRVQQGPQAMVDYGFTFEWAILQATALGLGTCWLGGTLKRSAFGRAVGAEADELIPAVSPVGRARSKRRALDRVMRWGAGSARRKDPAALFFAGGFDAPADLAALGDWGRVLQMVRLGPSASNKQPWRVVVGPGSERFDLFIQRNAGYGLLGDVDLQRIDAGIATCHFQLAAKALQLPGTWKHEEPAGISLPERTEYVLTWVTRATPAGRNRP
jgi:nitroreductase